MGHAVVVGDFPETRLNLATIRGICWRDRWPDDVPSTVFSGHTTSVGQASGLEPGGLVIFLLVGHAAQEREATVLRAVQFCVVAMCFTAISFVNYEDNPVISVAVIVGGLVNCLHLFTDDWWAD